MLSSHTRIRGGTKPQSILATVPRPPPWSCVVATTLGWASCYDPGPKNFISPLTFPKVLSSSRYPLAPSRYTPSNYHLNLQSTHLFLVSAHVRRIPNYLIA